MLSLCISVFRFVQLTAIIKLLTLQPYGRKYLLVKATNPQYFSTKRIKFLVSRWLYSKHETQFQIENPIQDPLMDYSYQKQLLQNY